MRKKFLVLLAVVALVGCGEKFPYTSDSKKKEILKVMTDFESDDVEKMEKAAKEQRQILEELQRLAYQGDEKASKELEKWEKMAEKIIGE